MKEIAYISRPQGLVFDDDVHAILRHSRERNRASGITGVLVYDGDAFLQVIEGEDSRVDALFEAIQRDPRHTDIEIVANGAVHDRAFSRWSMDYRRVQSIMDELGPMRSPRADGRFGLDLFLLTA